MSFLLLSSCENLGTGDTTALAYITEVFDYKYGIGQHAGSVGSKEQQMARFIGTSPEAVQLGGWGGYIVGGFGSDVPNLKGDDFAVFTQPGVGSEPGVVFVMKGTSGSDGPADIWYELRGSETGKDYSGVTHHPGDQYVRSYEVTFTPAEDGEGNISWTDNQGHNGIIEPGYPAGATSHGWWWEGYGDEDEVVFKGVKLPDVKYDSGDGNWKDYTGRFTSGYAENYSGGDLEELPFGAAKRLANHFDISDALDNSGELVHIDAIRFIKVQSGVFQIAGWLNEISTEVSGAVNLHAPK